MKHYRVLLNGQNFLIKYEGKETFMGFYTTRFVVAPSAEEAELVAVKSVRDSRELNDMLMNATDRNKPKLFVEEIHEIEKKDMEKDYGFGWYKMEE